ncbi:MAG: hypothetical protein HQ568_00005, partial [Calditrichaeota bacterium]|nr:hypothetical protein [Calditrichota bacterium]
MKHLNLSLLILLLTLSTALASDDVSLNLNKNVTILSADNQSISMNFELSELEIHEIVKDNKSFDSFAIPDEGITYEKGRPILPAVSRFVIIPPRAGIELFVEADEPRIVKAANPPAVCNDENIESLSLADVNDYGLYPPVIAELSKPTVIRGVRMVKITTYPIQYNPSTNEYLHRDRILTKLVFTDDEPVNPARVPIRRNRSRNFLKYIETLAINGDQVGRDDPDIEPEYIGHYLVVIQEAGLQWVAPFIEWRRKSGYKVDILSLTSGQAGSAGTVEGLIQDRYDAYLDDGLDPFEYVLLVGDRTAYENAPGPGWVLQAHVGQTAWPNAHHGDYLYGCLEGNDHHPDVAITRWPGGSQDMLDLMVGRTLGYEATPYMENTEWFTRGGVYSQHWGNSEFTGWHPSIHTNVRWGVEVLDHLGFDDITLYEDFRWDREGSNVGPWMADQINAQTNVMIGRAENYYFCSRGGGAHSFDQAVDETNVFPIDINSCGHGEWARETMYRVNGGDRDNLKGWVATSYGWGFPSTVPMSAVWLEWVNAVMLRGLPYGWGRTIAITAFEAYIPDYQYRNNPIYRSVKTDIDAFGDPGLVAWIGVPKIVEAEFKENITPQSRLIEVHVTDANDDNVEGAQVTLYSPGDMPDYDHDDYAGFDEMFMITKKSDVDGFARFIFENEIFETDHELLVTITGRDICPFFGEIEIERYHNAIDVASYIILD